MVKVGDWVWFLLSFGGWVLLCPLFGVVFGFLLRCWLVTMGGDGWVLLVLFCCVLCKVCCLMLLSFFAYLWFDYVVLLLVGFDLFDCDAC